MGLLDEQAAFGAYTTGRKYQKARERAQESGAAGVIEGGLRGLLGLDPVEGLGGRGMEAYRNMQALSNSPTPLAAGIFIGKGAKTFNNAAAKLFEQLEKKGVAAERAWKETGTFRGVDGKLRQEIDDRSAFFPGVGLPNGREYNTLGQTIFHPQQRKAYPDLSNALTQTRVGKDRVGSYEAASPETATTYGREEEIIAQGQNRPEIRSTLLHEMQHAIQEREGFATGGGISDTTLPTFDELGRNINRSFEAKKDAIRSTPEYAATVNQILAAMPDSERYVMSRVDGRMIDKGIDSARYKADEQLLANIEQQRMATLDGLFKDAPSGLRKNDDRFAAYRRLAGEAEARAVQKRMDYTPEQRRNIFPLSDYDVPLDQLIVRGLLDVR